MTLPLAKSLVEPVARKGASASKAWLRALEMTARIEELQTCLCETTSVSPQQKVGKSVSGFATAITEAKAAVDVVVVTLIDLVIVIIQTNLESVRADDLHETIEPLEGIVKVPLSLRRSTKAQPIDRDLGQASQRSEDVAYAT